MPDDEGRTPSPDCTCWTAPITDTDEAVAACPVHRKAGRTTSSNEEAAMSGERHASPCEKYPHDGCGCPLDDGTPLRGQSPLHDELAARVRANLAATGTTQKALAEVVGVTEKHVSRVLSGHVDGSLPFWDALLRESALPRFVRCNGGPDV